ncbi:hypothetical protein DIURU_001251 [Diutina rugosa]|uniref:Mediator of RNA polymerase II transcription subunit 9 n=1 Tax=Diutina rugosa TaxID=5481 RepID=A0A642UZX9_DIURU|nr:uncharacterized protein DIURU_001251 [Diutina rugosa]KAA8906069.1 hypothetical protein DIURU_001251 [Diutina rugosa]
MNTPAVPSPLANVVSADDQGTSSADDVEFDAIEKLKEFEVLPTLYSLLHDLQTGHIKAKDFDNNAGSLRLKLSLIRQYLSQIEGISETVKSREVKIDNLKTKNYQKWELLQRIKSSIQDGQPALEEDAADDANTKKSDTEANKDADGDVEMN